MCTKFLSTPQVKQVRTAAVLAANVLLAAILVFAVYLVAVNYYELWGDLRAANAPESNFLKLHLALVFAAFISVFLLLNVLHCIYYDGEEEEKAKRTESGDDVARVKYGAVDYSLEKMYVV